MYFFLLKWKVVCIKATIRWCLPNHKSNCSNSTGAMRGSLDHPVLPGEWLFLFAWFLFTKVVNSQLWAKFMKLQTSREWGHPWFWRCCDLIRVCSAGEDVPALARPSKLDFVTVPDCITRIPVPIPRRCRSLWHLSGLAWPAKTKGKPARYPQQRIAWKTAQIAHEYLWDGVVQGNERPLFLLFIAIVTGSPFYILV